ncbi:Pycsar system effector family protein [Streptomyces sp. ST2-7A]|uniref:Pycsar system effector family protein n=1 Tax=Streptomyces sp. ST2-7A TaxID=2907214 RepID=UPI001F1BC6C9|nr:Pycsar system effector family protein [Streptomyces sp. ST2-7A]MCE7082179.1 DUF5706 domain-containing protein [Streptomyces sp. ST2-7A]
MTATPAPGAGPPAGERVAERLLTTVREDLGRADTKVSVLVSGSLALPVLLIGLRGNPAWQGPLDLVLVAAGVCWTLAVTALVRALMPRTRTVRERSGVTFFGDLVPPQDLGRLTSEVTEAGRDPVGWLLVQAVDVSFILSAKYRAIRWGVVGLACSVTLALVWGLTAP